MPEGVNKRPYDRAGRQAASAATRQRILDAARTLVVEQGYRSTTIAAIARRAGVHADTVYALVGRKSVVLRELIEQAISGTDRAVVAEDRDYVKAIGAQPDPAAKIELYARAVREIQQRMAPLFLALREASSTETEARQIWDEITARRAANMRKFARQLRATGGMRPGLTADEAADTVWVMNSSEVFVMLTVDRGWSAGRYERWLADTWIRLLLDPDR